MCTIAFCSKAIGAQLFGQWAARAVRRDAISRRRRWLLPRPGACSSDAAIRFPKLYFACTAITFRHRDPNPGRSVRAEYPNQLDYSGFCFHYPTSYNAGQPGHVHDSIQLESNRGANFRPVECTTARGFEPLRAEPNGFLVHHLNHSVTLSWRSLSPASSICTPLCLLLRRQARATRPWPAPLPLGWGTPVASAGVR